MIRTGEGLYMTLEEYDYFGYAEADITYVICNDCDRKTETEEELEECPHCEGSVYYVRDIEGCECVGCQKTFSTDMEFYTNGDDNLCMRCRKNTKVMYLYEGQSLEECVREYEEEVY